MFTFIKHTLGMFPRKRGKKRPYSQTLQEAVPIPPLEIHIDNPNASDCIKIPKLCTVGDDSPCVACNQFGFTCQHLPIPLQINYNGEQSTIGPNTDDSEGFCLPPSNLENEINRFTTTIFLTFNSTQQVWNYRTLCKYPSIFKSLNDRSDCDLYTNPCVEGVLANGTQIWDTASEINFDPFFDGRCVINSGSSRVPVWDAAEGPRTENATIGSNQVSATSCPPGFILSTYQNITNEGYKPDVAAQLALLPTMCVPQACKIDQTTGEYNNNNVWDTSYKCCVCDWQTGWIPVFEDYSGGGNALDTGGNAPNACKKVPGTVESFEENAYVYEDGSSLNFINIDTWTPTAKSYQYINRAFIEPFKTARQLPIFENYSIAGNIDLEQSKPPCQLLTAKENLGTLNTIIHEEDQFRLTNPYCNSANGIIFSPELANGYFKQTNQKGEAIRSNQVKLFMKSKRIEGPTNARENLEYVDCSIAGCNEYKDIIRDWPIEYNMKATIPNVSTILPRLMNSSVKLLTNNNKGKDYRTVKD